MKTVMVLLNDTQLDELQFMLAEGVKNCRTNKALAGPGGWTTAQQEIYDTDLSLYALIQQANLHGARVEREVSLGQDAANMAALEASGAFA